MTQLTADASSTSAIWMSPSELEGILATTWTTPPIPPIRPLKSDSEVRALGWGSEKGFTALVAFAVLAFIALSRRSRPELITGAPLQRRPQPATNIDILNAVRATVTGLTGDIADRANVMVDRLTTELARMNLEGLPPMHASVGGDGAILIEWTRGRRRVGISLEARPQDSSWYYVSFDGDRPSSASGPISDLDLPLLLRRLAGE